MPFPNRPDIPRPGFPNQWDAIQEPDAPPEDPGPGGGGGCVDTTTGQPGAPGTVATSYDVTGVKQNWTWCVDPAEAARREAASGSSTKGGDGGLASQAGAGPQAPKGAAQYAFSPVPQFNAPEFTWNEVFRAPSYTEAEQDPGYQFRVNEGRRALEQSAAGRGTLRTGGTLKDIVNYGQNAASQEYGNVFDRYARGYDTRFSTEKDKYNFKYQGAKDTYAPKLFEWQTKTAFGTNAAQRAYERAYDDYLRSTLSASDILNAGRR